MVDQSITLPASALLRDTATLKRWEVSIPVDAALAPAGVERYVRRVIARNDRGPNNFEIRLLFGTAEGSAAAGGDDLLEAWETAADGVRFSQVDHDTGDLPGPNHADNAVRDASEVYIWSPPAARTTALRTFFFTDIDTSSDVILRLRVPSTDIVFNATAGGPSATIKARSIAPMEAAMKGAAGAPRVAISARAIAPAKARLRARAGIPRVSIAALSFTAPVALRARAGSPSAAIAVGAVTFTTPFDFSGEALMNPLIGNFGEPVSLPGGGAIKAIVDYDTGTEGKSWHFTMHREEGQNLVRGDEIVYEGRSFRIRDFEPDGMGLLTAITTRV